MSETTPRRPSVSSLASSLIRREPEVREPEPRVVVARPPLAARILIATALVLVIALTGGLFALYSGIGGLVEVMHRSRANRDAHNRADLPADAVLLDATQWRHEAATRPRASANLHLARCRLLAEAQRWQEVDDTVVTVGLTAPGDILPATRLLHAEALTALGRPAEATAVLEAIDDQRLDPTERERAADLAARLWSMTALGR